MAELIRKKYKTKHNLIESFGFAVRGIILVYKKERNFKIHCLFAVLIILAGLFFQFNYLEWLIIILVISMVLAAEILNSAIENICDLLKYKLELGYDETKNIRNYSAGAVLLTAFLSVLTGAILIINKILRNL